MKFSLVVFIMLTLFCPAAYATMVVSPDCQGAALCVLVTATNGYCKNAHHMTATPTEPLIPCTAPTTGSSLAKPVPFGGQVPGPMKNPAGPIGTTSITNGAGIGVGSVWK